MAKTPYPDGFTLIEVLIVLFILGLLVAMIVPAMGILDERERERITQEQMDIVRRAVLGSDDRFDDQGQPIIGGYVGDMRAWPDLWEARAEIRPNFGGAGWETPSALSPGLGQGPGYLMDTGSVYYRPSGRFEKKAWKWHRPYRKLFSDTTNNHDHIGGLETENEGQPRGLWTRYPEDLPVDLDGHPAPGEVLGDAWKGPYIAAPVDRVTDDAGHWAESDAAYVVIEPAWHTAGGHANHETWEDGDYNPSGELGEHFDEKESFRLLQADGRLADGWGRALRFFITGDAGHPGSTIFWIISEGPDGEGAYPNKGTCGGHAWTVDPLDTMGQAYDEITGRGYDENEAGNRDNLVMKLYSRDWEAVFAAQDQDKTAQTGRILDRLRAGLVGEIPAGCNTGLSGDICRWPHLFRWEDNGTPADPADDRWDDRNAANVAYTKGQPRGLWTRTPNTADTGDDLPASVWGIGWRHAYVTTPDGTGGEQVLNDAWDREILFFYDAAHEALLILSRGPDGKFAFGTVNADGTEPAEVTEAVDTTAYVSTAAVNTDNIYRVVAASDRRPGFFRIDRLIVLNAVAGRTKCRFFRDDGSPVTGVDLLTAVSLTDEDLDMSADDWAEGDGTPASPAFSYDDTTIQKAATGARYLVCWNDTDGDNIIDTGEGHYPIIFNVTAAAGSGQYETVTVNTTDFRPAP